MTRFTDVEMLRLILDVEAPTKNMPTDIYHQDFGWVLRKGKATKSTKAFLKYLRKLGVMK